MSTYKVGRKASTKELEVIDNADTFSAGFTTIGTFDHDDLVTGVADGDDPDKGHVLFHHVRDLLYKVDELDPSAWKILIRKPTAIDVTPAVQSKAAGQTTQLTTAFTPANSMDKRLTYKSSDPTKATVNESGLVSHVAAGTATITVTHVATGLQDTVAITVT